MQPLLGRQLQRAAEDSAIEKIASREDVAGLTVAVGSATNQEALLVEWNELNIADGLERVEIVYYEKASDYHLALGSGRIDAYLGPNPALAFHVQQTGGGKFVGTFSGGGAEVQDKIAVLTKKDNGLVEALAAAIIRTIDNGT